MGALTLREQAVERTAYKRGAEAMREAAAQEADCGCASREMVLARLESQGERQARYLCTHGDTCCATQAAAIRALPIPEAATDA